MVSCCHLVCVAVFEDSFTFLHLQWVVLYAFFYVSFGWFQWHVLPGKDEWDFYHELFGIDLSHTGWLPTDFYDNMQKRWIAIAVWMAEFPIIWLVLWTYIILQPITISISLTSVDFIFEFCVVISLWTGLVGIFSEIFELLNRW